MKALISLFVLIASVSICHAQGIADSVQKTRTQQEWQKTMVSAPLLIGGLIVKNQDDHFRRLRNDYMKHYHTVIDNYTQYLPAATMLIMKAAGVESRSSWERMLSSDAFATILMGSVVYSLKNTTNVTRPDGSDKHSFPSGHTATAFMTATMLSKEYGERYPLISVGAYGLATATGLMRISNNKHWLSDAMFGAGVGILSVEAGYWLTDLLFKSKGLNYSDSKTVFSSSERPSFIGLYLGSNIPLSHYDLDENLELRTSSGCTVGVEGAYFLNRYFGVGGRFSFSNIYFIVNKTAAEDETYDFTSYYIGPYFSYPIAPRLRLGAKVEAGLTHYPKLSLNEGLTIRSRTGFSFSDGISLSYDFRKHFNGRLFLDHSILPPHSSASFEYMHTLTLGMLFAVTF